MVVQVVSAHNMWGIETAAHARPSISRYPCVQHSQCSPALIVLRISAGTVERRCTTSRTTLRCAVLTQDFPSHNNFLWVPATTARRLCV
jgi:hypothetical protein